MIGGAASGQTRSGAVAVCRPYLAGLSVTPRGWPSPLAFGCTAAPSPSCDCRSQSLTSNSLRLVESSSRVNVSYAQRHSGHQTRYSVHSGILALPPLADPNLRNVAKLSDVRRSKAVSGHPHRWRSGRRTALAAQPVQQPVRPTHWSPNRRVPITGPPFDSGRMCLRHLLSRLAMRTLWSGRSPQPDHVDGHTSNQTPENCASPLPFAQQHQARRAGTS